MCQAPRAPTVLPRNLTSYLVQKKIYKKKCECIPDICFSNPKAAFFFLLPTTEPSVLTLDGSIQAVCKKKKKFKKQVRANSDVSISECTVAHYSMRRAAVNMVKRRKQPLSTRGQKCSTSGSHRLEPQSDKRLFFKDGGTVLGIECIQKSKCPPKK